ncbi:hypothetical protein F511_23194 [Dorcoceras hygrometricum]|uniref:Uncharacterized protein n=1 Tax=Dorcoceras hygrometricum TaxID=472368 RepID=A0A2Z7APK9_9LAMI|nr:hypothetical protein F511_23194 [Dorcoceras hygrometricum]
MPPCNVHHDPQPLLALGHPAPAALARAPPAGPPPGLDGPNLTSPSPNHGLTRENERREGGACAMQQNAHFADVDVNASQLSYSARTIRRRLVSARSFSRWLVLRKVLLLVLLTSVERRRLSKWQRRVLMLLLVSAGGSALRGFAFTRVFGISSSVIVLSIRYGFELILRRGYGLEKLLRGRAVIPHSHLPAGIVDTMRRVVNYHSSWARQQQVELFDAAGKWGLVSWRVAHYHTVNSPRGH